MQRRRARPAARPAKRVDPETGKTTVVESRAELVDATPVVQEDVKHIDPKAARLFALQVLGSMVSDAAGILRRELSCAPMPRGLKGAPRRAQWVIETLLRHTDSVEQAGQIAALGELLGTDPRQLAAKRQELQEHVRALRKCNS